MAAVPPPSSDLLVAVFIVVTACLPTPDGRFASARRGVLFVFPARRPEDGKLRMLSLAAAFSFPISQPRRSMRRRALSLLKLFLSLIYLGCILYTFCSFLLELLTPARAKEGLHLMAYFFQVAQECACSACRCEPPCFSLFCSTD